MAGRTTRAAICLPVCVFVIDIRRLRPGQPLRGARRGAQAGLARPSCPVHPRVTLLVKETGGLHSVRRSRVPTSNYEYLPHKCNISNSKIQVICYDYHHAFIP
jgi:hypothetical protein